MDEFTSTGDLPDAWHDRMKAEVNHILERLEGLDITLALIILQSATLHAVYFNVDEDRRRMIALESWPEAGKKTFELWKGLDKRKE